jgi:hypothetical protein
LTVLNVFTYVLIGLTEEGCGESWRLANLSLNFIL